jgi:methyl coenzyme M reductase alpha subunit
VLTALVDALSADDVPHAAIEVEMLVWAHPAITDDQWTRHVTSASALYLEEGYGLLLVAKTVESDEDMAQLVAAIGADEHFAVRLEARGRRG